MSFPAYPSYRHSGFDWLGEIPADWRVQKFRFTFRESGEKIESEVVGPMLSVSGYRGIEVKDYDDENQRRAEEDLIGYRIVRPGQLVVNTMWLNYAGLGVSSHEGHVSPAYRAYWFVDNSADSRFIHYLLRSSIYVQGYTQLLTGIRPNSLQMSRADLMDFPVLLPPVPVQTAITAFLDHETAKIDALIEEQRRLIALLKEKRQAVIAHAVTKGLDPHTPMKDSGIEWLGEVPAHWQVVKVARYFRARKGKEGQLLTKEYCASNAGDHPVYSGQTENGGIMGTLDRYEFDTGSNGVLFSTTVGAKAMTVSHLKGRFSLSQNCMIIETDAGVTETRFYFYHLQPLFQYHRNMIPEHMQASFRMEDLYSFTIALPPLDEQSEIASHLDKRLTSFDDIEVTAAMSISLLQERRAALISAAVTGKIDLRGDISAEQEHEAA